MDSHLSPGLHLHYVHVLFNTNYVNVCCSPLTWFEINISSNVCPPTGLKNRYLDHENPPKIGGACPRAPLACFGPRYLQNPGYQPALHDIFLDVFHCGDSEGSQSLVWQDSSDGHLGDVCCCARPEM